MNLTLAASTLTGLSILLVVVGASQLRGNKVVRERLDLYLSSMSGDPITARELELSRPFSERVVLPLARRAARIFGWMWPQNRLNMLRTRILLAGGLSGMGAGDFVGIKGLSLVVLLGTAILFGFLTSYPLNYTSALMLGGLAFGGFFLPDVWLSSQIKKRQKEIVKSLPDVLDLLTITIEAGLSFESGLQEIVAKWNDELSREFARVLRDIGMGQSRRQSLEGLSERTGVPDVISFVTALNQAEELGVSIGRVLKVQAEEMRVKRRQRAQEQANQAPIKMMFPLVFLIFPAIFAVLLGPAVPQLLSAFGGS